MVEAGALPARELISPGGEQDRPRQHRQPHGMRGIAVQMHQSLEGEERHDTDRGPNEEIAGDEDQRGVGAAAAATIDREMREHHRRDGRQHHRHHHRHPHREKDTRGHVALSEPADLAETHYHAAHRQRRFDRAPPGEQRNDEQRDDDGEIRAPRQDAECRARRIFCRRGVRGRHGSIRSAPVERYVLARLAAAIPFETEAVGTIHFRRSPRRHAARTDFRSGRVDCLHALAGRRRRSA